MGCVPSCVQSTSAGHMDSAHEEHEASDIGSLPEHLLVPIIARSLGHPSVCRAFHVSHILSLFLCITMCAAQLSLPAKKGRKKGKKGTHAQVSFLAVVASPDLCVVWALERMRGDHSAARAWLERQQSHLQPPATLHACASLLMRWAPFISLEGHTGPVYCVCVTDKHIISGSWDKTVQ